jgi:predicted GIY-YIG superfamily endonuclease
MNEQGATQKDTIKTIEMLFAQSACCGIYGLRNKLNGKWYVGQSLDIRARLMLYRRGRLSKTTKTLCRDSEVWI